MIPSVKNQRFLTAPLNGFAAKGSLWCVPFRIGASKVEGWYGWTVGDAGPYGSYGTKLFGGRMISAPTKWQKKSPVLSYGVRCWHYLSSQAVARQVLSARMSLSSVFGMGTGGPSPQSIPTVWMGFTHHLYVKQNYLSNRCLSRIKAQRSGFDSVTTNHDGTGMFRWRNMETSIMCEELVTHTGFEPMLTA